MAEMKIARTFIIEHNAEQAKRLLGNLAGLWGDDYCRRDGNALIPLDPVSRIEIPASARPFVRETFVAYIECDDHDEYTRLTAALEARGPFVAWTGYDARLIAIQIGF